MELCLDAVLGGSRQGVDRVILETLGINVTMKYEADFKSEVVDPACFLLVQTKEEASEEIDLKHDSDESQEFVKTGKSLQDDNVVCIYCSEKFYHTS